MPFSASSRDMASNATMYEWSSLPRARGTVMPSAAAQPPRPAPRRPSSPRSRPPRRDRQVGPLVDAVPREQPRQGRERDHVRRVAAPPPPRPRHALRGGAPPPPGAASPTPPAIAPATASAASSSTASAACTYRDV